MAAVPSGMIHKVHPAAASDYFGNSKFKSFMSRFFINALLIPRKCAVNGEGPDPIELMTQRIKDGGSLILFPEGSRGEVEVMQQFKRGIGLLLQRFPEIPVIPVYLEGLGKSLPKGESLMVPFNSMACFDDAKKVTITTPEDIASQLEIRIMDLKTKYSFIKTY
jgi:1-acyl-sn-glycerol-3-phosphate acyltransferase